MQPQEQISVTEAAKYMGRNPQFVRYGLQQKMFDFGVAVKMDRQWSYIIFKNKFFEWLGNTER